MAASSRAASPVSRSRRPLAVAGCGGAGNRWRPCGGGRLRVAATSATAHGLEDRPPAVWRGRPRLPARLAADPDRPRDRLRGAARIPRTHPRLPERDAAVGRRDARELEPLPPRPQSRRGRSRRRDRGSRQRVCASARGRGSCVVDRYATASARYREIACIVHGSRATTVVVAAAAAARLGPARADIAAFGRELLDLTGTATRTAIGQRVDGFSRVRRRRCKSMNPSDSESNPVCGRRCTHDARLPPATTAP